ncbi:hypothetical protein GB931_06350 [Modestobacter sp. I12A-02628]|uniref:Pirin N-terminal domain-containing protein n=1 Tax=Goekera deserti TaxID=2497753 RepID=A0A7K3WAV0_9ACTN|nr:pirin family protein [Goekera deserti]MPQ97546.1 hypothetical protein [Goekera deserti]NDI47850.1 hypothetical protein [Goekera deserti]NEL53598.1 hypothetical protein [Goekera deserti]
MTAGLVSRVLHEVADGSLGPLLRVTEDSLAPGAGYGRHAHRDVDVVAVVLAGGLTHAWSGGAELRAGDVGVLRAGTGLEHDEVAGPDGALVVQTYLRAAAAGRPPAHEVRAAPSGWVDLDRDDARLWLGPAADAPGGVLVPAGPGRALVWQLDPARPSWAC